MFSSFTLSYTKCHNNILSVNIIPIFTLQQWMFKHRIAIDESVNIETSVWKVCAQKKIYRARVALTGNGKARDTESSVYERGFRV